MKFSIFTTAALLTAATTANPLTSPNDNFLAIRDSATPDPRSVAIVEKIAPSSTSCSGASFPSECATADQATQPLVDAFNKYQVSTPGEQAALLSYMAYESGEFKYNKNHFPEPGRPGQGTRIMMMPNYVKLYAASLGVTGSDDASILANVIAQPGGEWGAASWFMTTQCSADVRKGLQNADQAGFEAFISGCVQTTMDDKRLAYWKTAAQALGIKV